MIIKKASICVEPLEINVSSLGEDFFFRKNKNNFSLNGKKIYLLKKNLIERETIDSSEKTILIRNIDCTVKMRIWKNCSSELRSTHMYILVQWLKFERSNIYCDIMQSKVSDSNCYTLAFRH